MFIEQAVKNPTYFFAVVITVVVSICIHELAHGVVAVRLGDRTPIESGHMTLNPAVHLGLFSVIALLLAGIAWGSMPVDPTRLRGRYGDALVAVAGPLSNTLLALLSLGAYAVWLYHGGPTERGTPAGNLQYLLLIFGFVNFNLALFNLIPIPPLDGAHILANLSKGYAMIADHLKTSGASMIIFLLVFSAAGAFTQPLADKMTIGLIQMVMRACRWFDG